MKIATVRDLRYDFPKIEAWLAGGEVVVITKRSKPIARLTPDHGTERTLPPLPDFRARLKRTWGERIFASEEVEAMRALETGEP